jgi:hypothetical protein
LAPADAGHLLDGLEAAAAPLRRVVIYQGFKIYGIHLGAKVRTPARASDPPHMPPNIYVAQEAQLKARSEKSRWDYVALRPRRGGGRRLRYRKLLLSKAMVVTRHQQFANAASAQMRGDKTVVRLDAELGVSIFYPYNNQGHSTSNSHSLVLTLETNWRLEMGQQLSKVAYVFALGVAKADSCGGCLANRNG